MKVIDLLMLHDSSSLSQEHWSFSIYDTKGNIQYGYINSVYPLSNVHSAILTCEVISFKLGYTSLSIGINPDIKFEYRSEKKCQIDEFEHIDLKEQNPFISETDNNLYTKYDKKTDSWIFAKVIK